MTKLDFEITKYVNDNIRGIIRVLLDYLEDNNGFAAEDFLPYNNLRINNETWVNMVYDLYDVVRSDVIREYIKPKYEFLLFIILQWWEDSNNDSGDLLINKLDNSLTEKIQAIYTLDDGENYILYAISNFKEYYYILFFDHDFLPHSLERLVLIYLREPELFNRIFSDVDLKEYRELMPKDLQEQFDEYDEQNSKVNESRIRDVSEKGLLTDMLFCCERLQANHSYKDALEDDINDFIRDLLTAISYDLRDQTRQGTSDAGKQAGEVDILIRKENMPFAIVEGLRLSSVDRAYISKHINKIYKYDTLGNGCNFLIGYVKAKNFNQFWGNYIAYLESYNFPFELMEFNMDSDNQYSELKVACAKLKRNDMVTNLYCLAVHLPD